MWLGFALSPLTTKALIYLTPFWYQQLKQHYVSSQHRNSSSFPGFLLILFISSPVTRSDSLQSSSFFSFLLRCFRKTEAMATMTTSCGNHSFCPRFSAHGHGSAATVNCIAMEVLVAAHGRDAMLRRIATLLITMDHTLNNWKNNLKGLTGQ